MQHPEQTVIRPRPILAAVLAAIAFNVASGRTLRTKDGQTFVGKVIEETEKHIRLKTPYGELTVPRSSIAEEPAKETTPPQSQSKPKAAPKKGKPPKKLNLRQRLRVHREAMAHFKKKEYARAIARYGRILASEPHDRIALYNTACAHALLGQTKDAIRFLVRSAEAGFVDFGHIERDPDLESLREEPAYGALLARREELVRMATDKAVERITEQLERRKIDASAYRTLFDPERRFVYVHARDEEDIRVIRDGLEDYAEHQWEALFQNKPGSPVYIVLLTREDSRKVLGRRIGGFFQRAANVLFCGDIAAHKLTRTSVVVHEFTHALHFADQGVRRQQHPIWLVEGLATLFESSDLTKDGRYVPRHNQRLAVIQEAVRGNRSLPWTSIVRFNQLQFMRAARVCYAQARYMLLYMYEKGLLKPFYDEYTEAAGYESDRTAREAFEIVFGKPMATIESDWKDWLLAQTVPPIPFLGVGSREEGKRLFVTEVMKGSGAEKAGLKKGDHLVALDGTNLNNRDRLLEAIGEHDVGDEVELVVMRGEKEHRLTATLGKRGPHGQLAKRHQAGFLGLAVDARDGGVFVKSVAVGSPAAKAGIPQGARILKVDGKAIGSVRDYLRALKARHAGEKTRLRIRPPDGEPKEVTVTLGEVT